MKQIKFFCNKCNKDITNEYRYHTNTKTIVIDKDGHEVDSIVTERDFCFDCMEKIVGVSSDKDENKGAEK